jgi:hypothetical protein
MCWIIGMVKVSTDSTVASVRRMVWTTSMKSVPSGTTASCAEVRDTTPICAHGPTMAVPQGTAISMMGTKTLVTIAPSWASYAMVASTTCTTMKVSIIMREHHSGQTMTWQIPVSKSVAVVEQLLKGGDGVMVYRHFYTTHVHLAVLSTCDACAQHMVVWSAPVRPRPHSYLWDCHTLFGTICVLFVWQVYYMHGVVTYVCGWPQEMT